MRSIFLQNNQQNDQKILEQLLFQSLQRKTREAQLYRDIIAKAPDLFSARILIRLSANEDKALIKLRELYEENFGPVPDIEIMEHDYSYLDAILILLEEELNSVAFVREILDILHPDDIVRDVYQYVLLVDLEAEDLLGTLYNHYLHFVGKE